jgi:hypothetical protein
VHEEKALTADVEFEVDGVTLDFRDGQMTITGALRQLGSTPPEVVWVWAYFVNPGLDVPGSWSGKPIKLLAPFARGTEARINAREHFHWWNNSDVPRSGYHAHVRIATSDAGAAQVPPRERDYTLERTVPVTTIT